MILDIVIPRLDGLSILKAVAETGQRIPALILTGIDDPDVTMEAKKLGAIEVVHKHGVNDIARAAVIGVGHNIVLIVSAEVAEVSVDIVLSQIRDALLYRPLKDL